MLLYFGLPVLFLLIGYAIGKTVELLHIHNLERRESELVDIAWSNVKQIPADWQVLDAKLVDGQAVIGSDYFKTYASGIRNYFGGRHGSLETVMRRARREALVRMLEQARKNGANVVWNVRLETSNVASGGGMNRGIIAAEVYAYGTALRLARDGVVA